MTTWFMDFYKRINDNTTRDSDPSPWDDNEKQTKIFTMIVGWFFFGLYFYYLWRIAEAYNSRTIGRKAQEDDGT